MNLAAALMVLCAGLAVGATSIGGILVVPTLTSVAGIPVHEAIAAANFGFLFTGAAAVWLQRSSAPDAQSHSISRPGAFYLAAFTGAALGAFTLGWLPAAMVRALVAAVAILSGSVALVGMRPAAATTLAPRMVTLIGLGVGCASAWSGTGGPVLLLPVLILARMPLALAISLAQGVQLPIAGAATLVNVAAGRLDPQFGLMLGLLLVVGWAVGRRFARNLSMRVMQRVVAVSLISVGLGFGWQTFSAPQAY